MQTFKCNFSDEQFNDLLTHANNNKIDVSLFVRTAIEEKIRKDKENEAKIKYNIAVKNSIKKQLRSN